MPIGKGALRIAFEDFLTTFKFDNLAALIFKYVGENNEVMINETFKTHIAKLANVPGLENLLKLKFNPDGSLASQGQILTFAGLATGAGSQVSSGLFAPYMKLLNYWIEQDVLSYRLDPSSIIAGAWRDPNNNTFFNKEYSFLGIKNERMAIMQDIARPRLDPNGWLQLLHRGEVSRTAFDTELSRKGFLGEDISRIVSLGKVIPSITDLVSMAVREAFDDNTAARFGYDNEYPSEVQEWAGKQGLDPIWVKRFWRSHWQLPSPMQGYDMLHRLRGGRTNNTFTDTDMRTLLKVLDYPTFWRDRLMEISYAPFTRVDVRRMYKVGVLDANGVKEAYKDLGYNEFNATKLTDFTVKYETESGTSKLDEMNELSYSQARAMYMLGLATEGQFRGFLFELNYDTDDINRLVNLANTERALDVTPDNLKTYINKALSTYIEAYRIRLLDRGTATSKMSALGLPANQITIALDQADYEYSLDTRNTVINGLGKQYTSGAIDRGTLLQGLGRVNVGGNEQSQIVAEMDASLAVRDRRLTESQYTKCYKLGYITIDTYRTNLKFLGYCDSDIELLVLLATVGEQTNE